MRPTLCQDTLVPTVDAVILRHKGLDERMVLILCCKTSAGFDFTQEQLLVSPRQVGDRTWWEARRRRSHGATSLGSHSPRLGEACGRSCDSFTYPMPTCWSKLRNSPSPLFCQEARYSRSINKHAASFALLMRGPHAKRS